jgi:hypothetical protein
MAFLGVCVRTAVMRGREALVMERARRGEELILGVLSAGVIREEKRVRMLGFGLR